MYSFEFEFRFSTLKCSNTLKRIVLCASLMFVISDVSRISAKHLLDHNLTKRDRSLTTSIEDFIGLKTGEPADNDDTTDTDEGECTTPDQKPGRCISIVECPQLLNLIKVKGRNETVRNFILNSRCGKRRRPLSNVCCQTFNCGTTSLMTSRIGRPHRVRRGFTTRVVGGTPAVRGSWPWMVAIYCHSASGKRQKLQCGGTLISNEWVVTAAHCLSCTDREMKVTSVRVGDLNLDDSVDDGATPKNVSISRIIPHPKYTNKPKVLENDIALLRLGEPVKFSDDIRPVCLPSDSDYRSDSYYHGVGLRVAGWGDTSFWNMTTPSQLLEADLKAENISTCIQDYKEMRNQVVIDKKVICTGYNGKDSCQGDSGGPLVFWNPDTEMFYLAGVVSSGVGCAHRSYPGLYTKVAEFTDWISQETKLSF